MSIHPQVSISCLVVIRRVLISLSAVPSPYDDQQSVEDLYADLDAFITSGEEQTLEDGQAGMSSEEADAFIRDFLAGPSQVELGIAESTLDAVVETPGETSSPSVDPRAAEGHEEHFVDAVTPVNAGSGDADLPTAVEIVEYEVEEPITEGKCTVVSAHV